MILAIVLVILAAIAAALKFLGVDIDGHDLIALSLALGFAALAAAWIYPYRDRRLR